MKIEIRIFRLLSQSLLLMILFCGVSKAQMSKNLKTPIVDLGPDGYICDATPQVLNAFNEGCIYEWKFNNNIVSDSSYFLAYNAGIYSVKVIALDSTEAYDTINLKSAKSPQFSLIPEKLNNMQVEFGVFPVPTGCTFFWDFGDPLSQFNTSQLVYPTHVFSNIPATVTVVVAHVMTNCSKKDSLLIDVSFFESTNNLKASFYNVVVYPNPISEESILSFNIQKPESYVSLKVFDLLGNEVATIFQNNKYIKGKHLVDIGNFIQKIEDSIFIIRLNIDDNIVNTKVLKPN